MLLLVFASFSQRAISEEWELIAIATMASRYIYSPEIIFPERSGTSVIQRINKKISKARLIPLVAIVLEISFNESDIKSKSNPARPIRPD